MLEFLLSHLYFAHRVACIILAVILTLLAVLLLTSLLGAYHSWMMGLLPPTPPPASLPLPRPRPGPDGKAPRAPVGTRRIAGW